MANRSKAKGTAWETACVDYLRERLSPAAARFVERRTLNGAHDRGDIAGTPGVVWEAKACQTFDLAGWAKEAEAERLNDGADMAVVWIKAPRKSSPGDGYAMVRPDALLRLLHEAGYIELREVTWATSTAT